MKIRLTSFVVGAVALTCGALAAPANAAVTPYTGYDANNGPLTDSTAAFNSFTAALGTYGTDNLDSYADFTFYPSLTFAGTGITATTATSSPFMPNFVATYPPLAVSQKNVLIDGGPQTPNNELSDDIFTFSQYITGFGSFFSQGGDGDANDITFRLEDTVNNTYVNVLIASLAGGRVRQRDVTGGDQHVPLQQGDDHGIERL